MAVAGLHNVSVSRQWGNQDRPRTQASSLLQMWRELEGEHLVSHHPQVRFVERPNGVDNGVVLEEDANEIEIENEDDNSTISDQSIDLGEIERERVRQIFREWRNSGLRGHQSDVSHINNFSRGQLLGESERERVRVVREWVEMNTQERGTCRGGGEEQAAEIGSQIERVRDGLVVNNYEVGSRRVVRRFCGRQALIDLLMRAERERKREIQGLLEHRPVSDFSHRNRIQSHLRGRFLRNKRFNHDERSTSLAASELGLLRQRHTVSGLREGFLSRVDNFDQVPIDQSDTSSNDGIDHHINEHTSSNILQEVLDEIHPDESANEERDLSLESETGANHQGLIAHVEEREEQVLENEERERSLNIEFVERRDGNEANMIENWQGNSGIEWSQETLGIEGSGQGVLLGSHEVFYEHDGPGNEDIDVQVASELIDQLEGNTDEDFNWQDPSDQVEEWQDGNSQETTHQWYQERSRNDDIDDRSHLHEEWHDENDGQEIMDSWSNIPSGQEAADVGGIDSSYFPDDDSGHNLELRELLSRRRVSSLLRSGFRESLNQLIQSYVQRQNHASVEPELDSWSPSGAIVEQEHEQQSGYRNMGESHSLERTPLVPPSSQGTPPTLWDPDLLDDNWQLPNNHQRMGTDWEIINYLRIDMARLQQRMNNMQRMLEACMDMQLELQRSVRQEVSAALNRPPPCPPDVCEDSLPKNESKWEHVRKGICCICCDSNINSLLYRCGHMCTCSKCADILVQGRGKCPMCRAPVVEVIRAYSI